MTVGEAGRGTQPLEEGSGTPGEFLERESLRMDAVGAYIRGIDHEVVNILTLGLAAAELLAWRMPSEDPMAPCVENLLHACRRGVELNRQASHLALGTDPSARPIDLTACLRTSIDLLGASLPTAICLKATLTSGLWITIRPSVVHSVISILVHEASHRLGDGGGELKITLSEEVQGTERRALISIQSLLGPSGEASMPSGAHAILQANGGTLSWKTGPDGIVYTVSFPCTTVPYYPPVQTYSMHQLVGQERLALVEPDALLANALQDGLEALGYTLTVYHDTQSALDGLREPLVTPDLWITVPDPPDAEASSWAEALAEASGRPLLILAGHGSLPSPKGLPSIPKPFPLSELALAIRRTLGNPGPRELDSLCSVSSSAEPTPRPRTVLVAEDSRVFRNHIRGCLKRAGYQVIEAADGVAALETFIQASMSHPVDLVLTDIIMPRMDGLELIRQIRRLDHQIPIAIITSMEDQQTAKTALQLGVNDFLNKPFGEENLLECVEGMLNTLDHTRKAEDTAREVRLAHTSLIAVQENDLPIYSLYEPLSDAGGDILRCFKLPADEILFVLADIAGHSVVSSYAVASLLGVLSTFVNQFEGLRPLACSLNQAIQNGPFPDIPACALLGHWAPRTGRLHLLNAGLPYGLFFRLDCERTEIVEISGTPLGILPEPLVEERVLHLCPGDRMLFASDGFFEIGSAETGFLYHLAPEAWTQLGCEPIEVALNRMCEKAHLHGQGMIQDDLLIMGFEQVPLAPREDELHALLPSLPRYIDDVCLKLKEYMSVRCGVGAFSPSKRFEIILAAREALTNAVFHGNEGCKDRRICVHAWMGNDAQHFYLRVLDEGPGFDLEHHEAAMDPHSERGRGIPIMRHYCSRLTMIGGELTLEFEMEDSRDACS
ncbi:MAG: sensor hybrid histidine kinase [Holophagaceae bacterium]|nr:sensor hybrid histidine kinase [Holophagaceae bacterium]